MKRLNTLFLETDLKNFLTKQFIANNEGSFQEVQIWLKEYDEAIKNTHQEIIDRFSKLFPTAIVRLQLSPDGIETYLVKIYGVSKNDENLYDLCREIEEAELNCDYMLIPSVIPLSTTKTYYPSIYEEYVKKNSLESP